MLIAPKTWRTIHVVLVMAWLSTVTMLIPWPPATMTLLESHGMTPPSAHVLWTRWLLGCMFVVGGTFSAVSALRAARQGNFITIGFSVIYILYWLSAYVTMPVPVGEVIRITIRQIANVPFWNKVGVIQYQVLLPLVHCAYLMATFLSLTSRMQKRKAEI
jgi:hypothetical protein